MQKGGSMKGVGVRKTVTLEAMHISDVNYQEVLSSQKRLKAQGIIKAGKFVGLQPMDPACFALQHALVKVTPARVLIDTLQSSESKYV